MARRESRRRRNPSLAGAAKRGGLSEHEWAEMEAAALLTEAEACQDVCGQLVAADESQCLDGFSEELDGSSPAASQMSQSQGGGYQRALCAY